MGSSPRGGSAELLRSRGVRGEVVDNQECIEPLGRFIAAHPELWNDDIGR